MVDFKSYLRCSEDEMKDTILRLYYKGYSIKYITKKYYKYKNLAVTYLLSIQAIITVDNNVIIK